MRKYSRRVFLFVISSFVFISYKNKVFGKEIDNGMLRFFGDLSIDDLTISSFSQIISVNGKFYKLDREVTSYSIPVRVSISQWNNQKSYFKELSVNEVSYVDFYFYKKNVTPEVFGAIGDGIADDTLAMTKCFKIKNNIVLEKMQLIVLLLNYSFWCYCG
jgi:hypothetical protein